MAIEIKHLNHIYGQGTIFEQYALKDVNLTIHDGEFIGLIGHTGSGKSTLTQHLNGLLKATSGDILYNGESIYKEGYSMKELRSHVGLVFQYPEHQLFEVDVFSDVCFGPKNLGLPKEEIEKRAKEALDMVGLDESFYKQSPFDLSGGQKRRVAIAGVLAMKPEVLILDEPTAVLTPQETEKLFAVLRNMRAAGKSIIIITHKLNEVLELSDRVAVLRKGKYIDTVETKGATVESLTEMMVGEKVTLDINRTEPENAKKRIEMRGVTCRNKEGLKVLKEASFTAYSGEILGIAGISGSGQKELLESVAGLQPIESGEILYESPEGKVEKISDMKAEDIKKLGIALSFVPEDRLGMGLVGSMDLTDNMMIRSYKEGKHFFADRKAPKQLAQEIVDKLEVVTPGVETPVSRLSGGNVQKILVGREIASNPNVLMVAYPVRGLDINSSYTIYNLLNDQKKKGVAVICVGEDLDVLLELCDRILVLNGGRVSGIVDARSTTKEKLGLLMTGSGEEKQANE